MDFFDFTSEKSKQQLEFRFFFKKSKEEKAFLRDCFAFSLKSQAYFIFSASILFFFLDHSTGSLYIPFLKLILSLLLYKYLRPRIKSPIYTRIGLEAWVMFHILSLSHDPSVKIKLFSACFLGLSYSTFTNWQFNLLFWLVDNAILGGVYPEVRDFYNLSVEFSLILLLDLKLRGFWLMVKEEKRKNLAFSYILNKMAGVFFLVDHKLGVMSSNDSAKNLYTTPSRRKSLLSGLLKQNDLERIEALILEAKSNNSKTNEKDSLFKIELDPTKFREINEDFVLWEETLNDFVTNLEALKPKPPVLESPKSPSKSPSKVPLNINLNLNLGLVSPKKEEKPEIFPVKLAVFPLMFDRKMLNFLYFSPQREFFNFMEKIKDTLLNYHESGLDRLQKLEQDYIKWNNMQGLTYIKESDLKNLAVLVFELNFSLAGIFFNFTILPPAMRIDKDFNIHQLLTYIIELIANKAMLNNHELTLFFEASFPDFVTGQFFLFKYTILFILNLMVNDFEFPKHSKFKLSGKLKEYLSFDNENHFRLIFEFDYPQNPEFTNYLRLILSSNELKDPMSFFTTSKTRLKTNKNPIFYLQEALKCLQAHVTFKEKDDSENIQSFWLECSFKTVELSTFISSPNRSLTSTNKNTLFEKRDNNKISIPNINLSFSKNVHKKNLIVWKNKPNVITKPKNNALLNSLQKNAELNENFKRKISIRNKEESPQHHKGLHKDSAKTGIGNFEENTNFNFSSIQQKIEEKDKETSETPKSDRSPSKTKSPDKFEDKMVVSQQMEEVSPRFQKPIKAKSLDTMGESLELRKLSNHGHKSHFSNYDAMKENENAKNSMISSQVRTELEKIMQINKPKIRKILTKSILIMLQKQLDVKMATKNESPQTKRSLNLKLELGNLNFRQANDEYKTQLRQSKSATFKGYDTFLFKSGKGKRTWSTSGKRTMEEIYSNEFSKRMPLSPMLKKPKNSDKINIIEDINSLNVDEFVDENLYSEEQALKKAILPFDLDLDNSLDFGLNFLLARVDTQRRSWESNKMRSNQRMSYGKLKRSLKFLMLVIDDNINHLKRYQKISYNPGIIIDFSDNYKRGLEIFCQTFEQGRCYDIIILEMAEKTNEAKDFINEIREIERKNKVPEKEKVHIGGVMEQKEEGKKEELIEAGLNEVYLGEIDEEMMKIIVGKTSRGNSLVWK